jgi:hypothetical protein
MSGAGIQAAGTTSAGFGTPSTATVPEGAFLRDTKTGRSLGARQIDPNTRDYVLDTNGRILGVNYVRHVVQMSVHTERGSSAVQEMGHRLRTIQRITPNIEQQILTTLTEAVQSLINQGLIEVIGFTHFVAGDGVNGLNRGAVYGRFQWRDLTTNLEHTEYI